MKNQNSLSFMPRSCSFYLYPIFIIHLALCFKGSDGLRDVQLDCPRYVRRGGEVRLNCKYNLEGETLYAVKWYRNKDEFYAYIPKEVPPQKVYPQPGITVDDVHSNEHMVILQNVTEAVNGKYKCAVSKEITFQTLESTKELQVVVIGYDAPKLFTDKASYRPGEKGNATCTIEKTNPPVNITWFLNDKEVPKDRSKARVVADLYDPKLVSTTSTLTFDADRYYPFTLKCWGQMYDIYSESSFIKIQPKPSMSPTYPSVGGPDTLLRSDATTITGSAKNGLVVDLLLTFLHLLSAQLVLMTMGNTRLL